MAEEKKRRGRRDHLNDFYRDVSGNYVYTGVCYGHTGGVRANTALLRRLRLMAAVMAVVIGLLFLVENRYGKDIDEEYSGSEQKTNGKREENI